MNLVNLLTIKGKLNRKTNLINLKIRATLLERLLFFYQKKAEARATPVIAPIANGIPKPYPP